MIDQSIEELQRKLDAPRSFIVSILEDYRGDMVSDEVTVFFFSRNERRLKDALREKIQTLEQTRKAFKSKKLEILRKILLKFG